MPKSEVGAPFITFSMRPPAEFALSFWQGQKAQNAPATECQAVSRNPGASKWVRSWCSSACFSLDSTASEEVPSVQSSLAICSCGAEAFARHGNHEEPLPSTCTEASSRSESQPLYGQDMGRLSPKIRQ